MPFKSKAQQRFMFSQHPEMAKEWAEKTPDIKKLPEHVKKMAFGGETNPEHETVKAMENNPTAGFAGGGQAEADQDFASDDQGLQTPPEVLAALGMLAGGASELPNMAEDAPEMLGNESGAVSLGGNAPEMEGEAPKITAYVKAIQKNPNGADIKLYGVKGSPEDLMREFNDPNPGSVPEQVLRDKGILPDTQIDMGDTNAPNGFAEGGEAKPTLGSENPILAKLKELLGSDKSQASQADAIDPVVDTSTPTPHMDNGGDISTALQQLLQGPAAKAAGYAMNPMGAISDAVQSPTVQNMVKQEIPAIAGAAKGIAGIPPTPPPPPQTDPAFMAQLQAGIPGMTANPTTPTAQPPAQPVAQPSVKTAPQPEPDLYQGISAEDRAALANKLVNIPGTTSGMVTNGLAGLGDAISNSFGKGGSNFQQQNRQNMANQANAKIGVMDTQRQQRMQDLQAKIAVQENDPDSPYSQGSRAFAQAMTGKRFPSGVSASQIKMFFPDVAKIMDSQLTSATALHGQTVEAQKAGANMGFGQRLLNSILGPSPAETALQNTASGGNAPQAQSGPKLTTPGGINYTVSQ